MILLQAALGYGYLLDIIFNGAVFVGIPVLGGLIANRLAKGKGNLNLLNKIKYWIIGLSIATLAIAFILFFLWKFFLSRVDLSNS